MNRKRIILLTILVLIGLSLLYTSFGFFNTKILGNETSKLNTFKNNPLTIVYSDNTNTIVSSEEESFTPGSTITKTFSVTNPGSTSFSYSISLDEITNTFTRTQDITYTLSLDGIELITDTFPTTTKVIVYNQIIEPNETLNYILTVNYLNSTENQIEDSGASIGAKLVFNYAESGYNNILIYGNSIQNGTPTPDNPIEIQSVGEKNANLLKTPKGTITGSGLTITADGNTYKIVGTVTTSYAYLKVSGDNLAIEKHKTDIATSSYVNEPVILKAGETYTIQRSATDTYVRYIYATFIDGTATNITRENSPVSFEYTPSKDITAIWYQYYNNTEIDTTFTSWIVRGSASAYEQYNKYKVPISIKGANIVSPKNIVSGNNNAGFDLVSSAKYINSVSGQRINVTLPAWKAVATEIIDKKDLSNFSFRSDQDSYVDNYINYQIIIQGYDANGTKTGYETLISTPTANNMYTIELDDISKYSFYNTSTSFRIALVSRANSITNMNIEFYVNSTDPYYGINTNIYLDEPLRKIGDYADYIDIKNKKVVRNIKEVNLNTTLTKFDFSANWDNNDYTTCYFYTADKVIDNIPKSNYFPSSTKYSAYQADITTSQITTNMDNNYIYIKLPKSIATSKTELNTWLSTLSTPVRIYYQLATPVEEPINAPNLSIFPYIENSVSVNTTIQPSNIEVISNKN